MDFKTTVAWLFLLSLVVAMIPGPAHVIAGGLLVIVWNLDKLPPPGGFR